jgi:hypothetical protein
MYLCRSGEIESLGIRNLNLSLIYVHLNGNVYYLGLGRKGRQAPLRELKFDRQGFFSPRISISRLRRGLQKRPILPDMWPIKIRLCDSGGRDPSDSVSSQSTASISLAALQSNYGEQVPSGRLNHEMARGMSFNFLTGFSLRSQHFVSPKNNFLRRFYFRIKSYFSSHDSG